MRKALTDRTKIIQLVNTVLAISILAYSLGLLVGSGKIKLFGV